METIDLNRLGSEPIILDFSNGAKLETGIELLMNPKVTWKPASPKINFSNMDDLEKEFDNIVRETEEKQATTYNGSSFSNWFSSIPQPPPKISIDSDSSKVWQATIESIGNTQTWDGFTKLNDSCVASEK